MFGSQSQCKEQSARRTSRIVSGAKARRRPRSEKVRLLCVGHLSPRKGTPYLIQAWRRLGMSPQAAELTLAGAVSLPVALLTDLPPGVPFLPKVFAWDWWTMRRQ